MQRTYELTVLLPANLLPDEVKAVSNSIRKLVTSAKGDVSKEENMGKKYLAYKIRKQEEALFVLFEFSVEPAALQAIERDVRLMDTVMRSLIVLKEN